MVDTTLSVVGGNVGGSVGSGLLRTGEQDKFALFFLNGILSNLTRGVHSSNVRWLQVNVWFG